jgi:hypothetical protein
MRWNFTCYKLLPICPTISRGTRPLKLQTLNFTIGLKGWCMMFGLHIVTMDKLLSGHGRKQVHSCHELWQLPSTTFLHPLIFLNVTKQFWKLPIVVIWNDGIYVPFPSTTIFHPLWIPQVTRKQWTLNFLLQFIEMMEIPIHFSSTYVDWVSIVSWGLKILLIAIQLKFDFLCISFLCC